MDNNCLNEEKIIQLIDKELSGSELKKITSHLRTCPNCMDTYKKYMAIKKSTVSYYKKIDVDLADIIADKIIKPHWRLSYLVVTIIISIITVLIIYNNIKRDEIKSGGVLKQEAQIDKKINAFNRDLEYLDKQIMKDFNNKKEL